MSDETTEEYKLVENKKNDMQPVFDRMAEDEKLYFLSPYSMKQLPPNDSKDMPDVANITLNDPLLYANKAIAIISGAQRQTVIEGEGLSDKQSTTIEQFLDDVYYLVNEWLVKRGIVSLDAFINEQICLRGRIVGSSRIKVDSEGNLIPDVLPRDARFFVYENDQNGMVWGAPIMRRSKKQIEREYDKEIHDDFGEVIDLWTTERNIVFVEKEVVIDEVNPYGYPPFVVSICPIGSTFNSEDATEHQGESIFWSNRELWKEKNRTATILQTLNIQALFGGLQYESSKGEAAPKPEESPYGPRKVVPVEQGGGFKPIPVNDIKNATRMFYSVLDACLQRGSLSTIDYGTLTFPLSAVAITTLTGSRDDIFLPRIQAIALFYQALSRMIIDQCSTLDSVKLWREGKENTYSKSDFNGDYSIKYRFYATSKEQTAADLSIATAAQGFLSGDTIRREILNLQDPDGEQVKWESEQAEKIDEVLFLYRRASKLIEDEKPLEAYILAKRIVSILKQRDLESALMEAQRKGKVEGSRTKEEVETAGENKAQPLLPLVAGEAARGVRTPTPAEEVESE